MGEIEKAVKSFDACEARLLRQFPGEAAQIQQATATLKTICTGNLAWRFVCPLVPRVTNTLLTGKVAWSRDVTVLASPAPTGASPWS